VAENVRAEGHLVRATEHSQDASRHYVGDRR
jgi:hypothetical protein